MQILEVKELRTYFNTPYGLVKAVDNVSFRLHKGEVLGIVGESGAGKSVTALSVLGLAPRLGAVVTGGEVRYAGKNLYDNQKLYRTVRGKSISLIPQEAGVALNPVLTVGRQMAEMYRYHLGLQATEARQAMIKLLLKVELPEPELTLKLFPHQLSGGTLQRVLLAMAISCNPDIIIADEPTSSLDVTVQAQVLGLIKNTVTRTGLAMILIAHDLGIISQYSDRVLVMYGGRVMESGPANLVLLNPRHPYTRDLLQVYRVLDAGALDDGPAKTAPHNPFKEIPGCVFAHRCSGVLGVCRTQRPEPADVGEGRVVACHLNKEQTFGEFQ